MNIVRIGIITLHRVVNYGSALQAYALQEYIEENGLGEVEIIDYYFPNKFHKRKLSFMKWLRKMYCVEIRDMYFRGKRKKMQSLESFYDKYYHLSSCSYHSVRQIMENPPLYDLYMTGSDQLWNVNTMRNDPVMYCEFAPEDKRRVSFGASFTNRELPQQFKETVRARLNKYSYIGVREVSSLDIVNDLKIKPNIVVENTCDPTLLLKAEDYDKLAIQSRLTIDGDYILVYALQYSYSPEPALSTIVKQAKNKLGCGVVVVDYYKIKLLDGDRIINGIGPCEFCWLFKHAKFVIANSFHAVMFSIIYRRPFVGIGPDKKKEDRRINDILELMGLRKNFVNADDSDIDTCINSPFTSAVEERLNCFIENSKDYLCRAIFNK